ncbi:YciI family protein [Pseudooceanicola aestuarii]|uniref:YciI family protein n=1 Tax=Pseudooceanicola aestuarii TaxID=2697319 RepID=UPI0013D60CF5|nr:YciI family protein [Pseudooceanicola aestuarii]
MLVALHAKDKPGALSIRKDNRDAHLAYLKDTGVVAMAGPLLDADGAMCGSLVVLDVADLAAAQEWVVGDPYSRAGLFSEVSLLPWNKVIG